MNGTERADRASRLAELVLEHCGSILAPGTATHMHEVHLLDVYAMGESADRAASNWLKMANRAVQLGEVEA
jgi:hypothetical protein